MLFKNIFKIFCIFNGTRFLSKFISNNQINSEDHTLHLIDLFKFVYLISRIIIPHKMFNIE